MSFHFNWKQVGGEISSRLQDQLQTALVDALKQAGPLNSYVHSLEVESFSLGDVPPFIEVLTIADGVDSLSTYQAPSADRRARPSHLLDVVDLSPTQNAEHSERPPRNVEMPPGENFNGQPEKLPHAASPGDPTGEILPECQTLEKSSDVTAPEESPCILDALHDWSNPEGLLLRIRCSYGGNMHCKVRCVLNYSSTIHDKLTLGVSMPISCAVRNLNMNCNFLCNVKDGAITASIEKMPRCLPIIADGPSTGPADDAPSPDVDCAHTLRFDLIVTVGAKSTYDTPLSSRWSTTIERSGFFPLQLPTLWSAYDTVRSFMCNRDTGIVERLKELFRHCLETVQRIPLAMQRGLLNRLDACARHKYTGECVDERVVAAFVRDRLNLWIEGNLMQPNSIRVAG
ncbi:Mdm12 protein [Perkinsela sp. CCAP 1560/4]|nr:Mdm12 protein [Perkinsela sp. CCAP 1560/4]KNH03917.1 Mdm12 protein [Perkinsela sp. CCAP 1560/4]|eukprot:KNH01802.1 Mdm12 protein [Perkinsela sp. CCAP 1560/4]